MRGSYGAWRRKVLGSGIASGLPSNIHQTTLEARPTTGQRVFNAETRRRREIQFAVALGGSSRARRGKSQYRCIAFLGVSASRRHKKSIERSSRRRSTLAAIAARWFADAGGFEGDGARLKPGFGQDGVEDEAGEESVEHGGLGVGFDRG